MAGYEIFTVGLKVKWVNGEWRTFFGIDQRTLNLLSPHQSKEEITKGLEALTNEVVTDVFGFHVFAFERDMYLTEVHKEGEQSARDKRTLRIKPWATRNLPRLIYLNKLPSEHKEHQGGHHASPKPHQRRGCFKTLSHEKFKHHPKYQVDKGVYCRPAFVGDTSKIFEGNRYTIITGVH